MTMKTRDDERTSRRRRARSDRRAEHSAPEALGAGVVEASEFEAECRRLLDEVAAGDGEIVISKNGRAVCRLVPAEAPKTAPIGKYRDWIDLTGDIVAPVDVEWEAETNPDRVLDPSLPPRSSADSG